MIRVRREISLAGGGRGRHGGAASGPRGDHARYRTVATANSGIRGNAGLDRTSAARRRAGCGALSTRCAVVSTGGTHLTHTTHPIMNGSLLCMHTRDTRTIPRQRISCLIVVVRHAFTHAFTHASLPSPPRGKAPAARQLFGRPAPRRQLCPRQGHKCATRHRL